MYTNLEIVMILGQCNNPYHLALCVESFLALMKLSKDYSKAPLVRRASDARLRYLQENNLY